MAPYLKSILFFLLTFSFRALGQNESAHTKVTVNRDSTTALPLNNQIQTTDTEWFGEPYEVIQKKNYPNIPLLLEEHKGYKGMMFYQNQIDNITILGTYGTLFAHDNLFTGGITVYGKGNFKELALLNNDFSKSTSRLSIGGADFHGPIQMEGNHYNNLDLELAGDSLYRVSIEYPRDAEQLTKRRAGFTGDFRLSFSNCYINGPVTVGKAGRRSIIIFKDCIFGPYASLLRLIVDTVVFEGCGNLPATTALQLEANQSICWIRLDHTNFASLDFVYGPSDHLKFDDSVGVDVYSSTYEALKAKFHNENKAESYQRIDIEYRQFKAGKGTRWDKLEDWSEKVWWNYGYSKWLVIWWTLFLLTFFYLSNALLWKQMQQVYPIRQEHNFIDRKAHPLHYALQKQFRIFLYTSYIFFSVRIDLARLNVTNGRMVAWLFIEFLTGLWCLFFIANALLKVG